MNLETSLQKRLESAGLIKTAYNGNPKLKKVGTPVHFTPDQVNEFLKCQNDPVYFIKNYIKIVNVDRGLIPFELWDFQETMVNTFVDYRFSICKLPRQVGKVLRNEEIIPTPQGMRRMDQLKVGSQVFDETGKPCNVVFVSEEQNVPFYKITFDDGSVVECCEDHQWTVFDRLNQGCTTTNGRKHSFYHREVTDTIKGLYNRHWKRRNARGYDEYAFYIPNTNPVEYEAKKVLVDPYQLGIWLGDGTSRSTDLTCHIKHKTFYEEQGVEFRSNRVAARKSNLFTSKMNNFTPAQLRHYGILQTKTGIKTKRIPTDYLFNDTKTRIAVLQGLMDTDGFVEKNGVCCIQLTRKNQPLIEDVYTLLCSLGLKVFRSVFENTNSERLQFTVGRDKFDVCRIPHKLERQKKSLPNERYVYSRTIQNIEPLNVKKTGRCIQVDSPRSLYLCTPSYIPTHNTTTVAATILWLILFHENYSAAILANKLTNAQEILGRLQLAYENMPKWLQHGVIEWNKRYIELENGSKVIAAATSASAVRGGSYNLIYLDEFAFVPNNIQDEFFASTFPTISSGNTTKVVITSTPNGMNMFHKIWTDAEKEENDYQTVQIHWSMVPGRDQKWKEMQVRNTSEEQFRQEFECEFLGSTHTLISGSKLAMLTWNHPLERRDNFCYYKEAVKGNVYVAVVDTARGVGLDYSAFIIFDVTKLPYEVVCTYRNNTVSTMSYPKFIADACYYYNNAYILVETNDAGQQIADILIQDIEYDNVLSTMQKKKVTQSSGGFGANKSFVGIRTTKQVKRIGCSTFKAMVESDRLLINSRQLFDEMCKFSLKGTSYEAEVGNDDLVMCGVLFAWLTAQPYFRDLTNVDLRRSIYEQTERELEDNLVPFGFVEDGMEEIVDYDELFDRRERAQKELTDWF